MGRKGLQLIMDAKLQNSAIGLLRCIWPGAGVSASGSGKGRGQLSPPSQQSTGPQTGGG